MFTGIGLVWRGWQVEGGKVKGWKVGWGKGGGNGGGRGRVQLAGLSPISNAPSVVEYSGSDRPASKFRSELNSRLLAERTIGLNEALTAGVAGEITEQLTVLDAESVAPIALLMSHVPGGDVEVGLSIYDLIRSLAAPVVVLGSGRIAGAGILAFVGAPSRRRFALPHVRFRFEEPADTFDAGGAGDLAEKARAAADCRGRVVSLLAAATGQSDDQIETDLSRRRAFEADEAVDYGLIERVVESRREIEW